jgi:hypothetical protein
MKEYLRVRSIVITVKTLMGGLQKMVEADPIKSKEIAFSIYNYIPMGSSEKAAAFERMAKRFAAAGLHRDAVAAGIRSRVKEVDGALSDSFKARAQQIKDSREGSATSLYSTLKDYAKLLEIADDKLEKSNMGHMFTTFIISALDIYRRVISKSKDEAELKQARKGIENIVRLCKVEISKRIRSSRSEKGAPMAEGLLNTNWECKSNSKIELFKIAVSASRSLGKRDLLILLDNFMANCTDTKLVKYAKDTVVHENLEVGGRADAELIGITKRIADRFELKGDYKSAAAMLRKIKETEPLIRLGDNAMSEKKFDAALSIYKSARVGQDKYLALLKAEVDAGSKYFTIKDTIDRLFINTNAQEIDKVERLLEHATDCAKFSRTISFARKRLQRAKSPKRKL